MRRTVGVRAGFWSRPGSALHRTSGLIRTRSAGTLCGMIAPVKLHRTWRPHRWSHRSFIAQPELADLYRELAESRPRLLAEVPLFWRFVSAEFGIDLAEHHG